MEKDDRIESGSMIIAGILLLILGICVMVTRDTFIFTMVELVALVFIIGGIIEFISLFLSNKKKSSSLFAAIGMIVFGQLIQLFPRIPVSFIIILFGIYALLVGTYKGITYVIYRKNKVKGRFILLIDASIFLLNGLALVLTPIENVGLLFFIVGLYISCLGVMYIRDGLQIVVPVKPGRITRHIRINLPVLLVALLPYRSLQFINRYLSKYDDDGKVTEFIDKKEDEQPDIEVFIHVTKEGFGTLGHVDLCFKGEVISYGNYDHRSFRLHETIGDGVLFFAPKEKYIPFCIEHSKKTLFSFGLKLSPQQYQNVEVKIEEIKSRLVEWDAPITLDPEHPELYSDYASILVRDTGAKTYKFKNSRFKTYFVLSTNCVLLADSVLGKAGTDLLNINGIITPGAYYDYFEKEFKKKDSFVITRAVYK